jgi:two-component system, chemotaxis family, response regulator Rcp1
MKPINILLIEDNEGDIVLTIEALREGKLHNNISVARDGQEAIMYFNKGGKYASESPPDIILLDINLPKIDGKEVLRFIKSHPVHKKIPVIILTTSSLEKDIADAYNEHANCYIIKPVSLDAFMDVIRSIEYFWISIVSLPK